MNFFVEVLYTNGFIYKHSKRKIQTSHLQGIRLFFIDCTQCGLLLSQFSELEEKIIKMLEGYRDVGQPLFATIVRGWTQSLIRKREHGLLENKNPCGFVRSKLDWTSREAIGATRELWNNWEEQRLRTDWYKGLYFLWKHIPSLRKCLSIQTRSTFILFLQVELKLR